MTDLRVRRGDPPIVIGHRGAGRDPMLENSVASARRAQSLGADWVEVDVHVDGLGRLVLQHDAYMPGGSPVSDVDTGGDRDSFEDLQRSLDQHVGIMVEVKSDCSQPAPWRVIDAVIARARSSRHPLLIASFDPTVLIRVREAAPHLPRGLIVRRGAPLGESARVAANLNCHVLVAHAEQVAEDLKSTPGAHVMRELDARGVNLWAWDVDSARASTLARLGVSGLVTDDIEGVRRDLKR